MDTVVSSLCIVFLIIFQETHHTTSTTQIEDGKYKDIVIGVSVRIDDDRLRELVTKLKKTLDKSSKFLCEATGGYASFGSARLLVPPNWITRYPEIEIKTAKSERFDTSEIQINDFGSQFFVQQLNECGKRGKYIQIPVEKLVLTNDNSHFEKEFTVMWSRLRYGIFPEYARGIYYNTMLNSSQPNSCTDLPLNWKFKTTSCNDVDNCEVAVDPLENTHISSSLLYDAKFEKIKYFCNESTHNPYANTPHNRICGGKSAWDVIMENDDFIDKYEQNCNALGSVEIEVVQHKCHRIFIGLAIESPTDVDEIGKTIESALVTLLATSNAINTVLTIINNDTVIFNNTFHPNNSLILSEQLNNTDLRSTSCVACVLNTLRNEINASSSSQCEYSLVLFTDVKSVPRPPIVVTQPPSTTVEEGSGFEPTTTTTTDSTKTIFKREIVQFKEGIDDLSSEFIIVHRNKRATTRQKSDDILIQFLKDSGVRVYGIVIGNGTDETIEELADFTDGNVFNLESLSHGQATYILIPLLNEPGSEKKVVIGQKTNNETIFSNYRMTFHFDEDSDVSLLIYHSDATSLTHFYFASLENTAHFNKDSCVDFQLQNSTACTIKNLPHGKWFLIIDLPTPSPVSVNVVANRNTKTDVVEIVNQFTVPPSTIDFGLDEKLQFFVRLQYGPYVIENARVTASMGESAIIEVKDDEINPDGSKTGVYVGSINSCSTTGRIQIKYTAESTNETCVRKPSKCERLTSDFKKYSDGSLYIISCGSPDQLVGNDITDLTLRLRVNSFEGSFTWTETWKKDTVSSYKLHYSDKFVTDKDWAQWERRSELKDLLPGRRATGVKRVESVNLKRLNGNLTFVIITTGKAGNPKLSNLVHYNVRNDLPVPETTTNTTTPILRDTDEEPDLLNYPYVIAGIVLLSVFIVGGVVVLLLLYKLQIRTHRVLPIESDS